MKNSIKLILLLLLPILAQANPTAFNELWGHTANVLDSLPVDSSTPTLNPLSRQIDLSETDIKGPLPFGRVYRSSLTLGLDQASLSDSDSASLAYYTQGRYSVGMGSGWRHQYSYRVYKNGTGIGIRAPSDLYPSWYTISGSSVTNQMTGKTAGTYTAAGTDSQGNSTPETIEIRQGSGSLLLEKRKQMAGHEVSSGSNEVDVWLVAQLKKDSGYTIFLNYEFVDDPDWPEYAQFLVSSIIDSRNYELILHRQPFDHEETGFTWSSVREGLITKVEQKIIGPTRATQTVEYEYEEMIAEGPEINVRFDVLSTVTSTVNPDVDYTYHEPEVVGVTSEGRSKYTLPVINTLSRNSQIMRTWEYGDNFIGTYSEADQSDYTKIEFAIARLQQSYVSGYQTTNVACECARNNWDSTCNKAVYSYTYCEYVNHYCPYGATFYNDRNMHMWCAGSAQRPIYSTKTYPKGTLKVYPVGSSESDNYSVTSKDGTLEVKSLVDSTATALRSGGSAFSEIFANKSTGYLRIINRTKSLKKEFYKDSRGRITQQTHTADGQAKTTKFEYGVLSDGSSNPFNSPTKITSPNQVIENTLNQRGQVLNKKTTSTLNNSSKIETFTYHEFKTSAFYGELNVWDGPRNDVNDKIQYLYYSGTGDLARIRTFYGEPSSSTYKDISYQRYSSLGQPTILEERNGLYYSVAQHVLDAKLRVIEDKKSGQGAYVDKSVLSYDDNNNLISKVNPWGASTFYEYDALGRLIKQTHSGTANNHINTYSKGRLIAIDYLSGNSLQHRNTYEYDNSGQLIYERDGASTTVGWKQYTYNANGALTQTVFPTAQGSGTQTVDYDGFGRVSGSVNAVSEQVTYGYDLADNLLSEIHQNNSGSNFTYAANGMAQEESNSDYSLTQYIYDEAYNPTMRMRTPVECASTFNSVNDPTQIDCVHAQFNQPWLQKGFSLEYDGDGNLSEAKPLQSWSEGSSNGLWGVSTQYEYDSAQRVIRKTQRNGELSQANLQDLPQVVEYSYSYLKNRLEYVKYPSGNRIHYIQGASGKTKEVRVNGYSLVNAVEYDSKGRLRNLNLGNTSGYAEWNYDTAGKFTEFRLTGQTGSLLERVLYSSFDNRQVKSESMLDGSRLDFNYDKLGQLTYEQYSKPGFPQIQANYTYDSNGNRTSRSLSGWPGMPGNTTYSYQNNILTSVNRDGAIESAAVLEDGVTNFPSTLGTAKHDAGRHRTESGAIGAHTARRFDYNHLNERTLKLGNNQTRQFVYDESSHLIGEYDQSGLPVVEYVWLDDKPIAAIYPSGQTVFIMTDHTNTPRRGLDLSTNQIVWSWNPDAFGVAQPHINNVEMNLRFPGQYYDQATGLHYNHNRYYAPELGRYLEPDPIGLEGGRNPYSYAGNDPVNNVDPSGLMLGSFLSSQISTFDINFSLDNAINQSWNSSNFDMHGYDTSYLNSDLNGLINSVNNYNGDYLAAVNIVTSDPVAYDRISESYAKLTSTAHGSALMAPFEASPLNYSIRVTNQNAYSCNTSNSSCFDSNSIYVDPYNSVSLETSKGSQFTSLAVILGHEFGHQAGTKDLPPSRMANILKNENPVRLQLGLPPRTKYAVPTEIWQNRHIR